MLAGSVIGVPGPVATTRPPWTWRLSTAVESRQVQGGRVVATGPGTPMTEPASMDDEPWKIRGPDVKYLPMQARVGDYALFFRKAAVEIGRASGRERG